MFLQTLIQTKHSEALPRKDDTTYVMAMFGEQTVPNDTFTTVDARELVDMLCLTRLQPLTQRKARSYRHPAQLVLSRNSDHNTANQRNPKSGDE